MFFGVSPRYEDIDWKGLDFGADKYKLVSSIDGAAWRDELALHEELFTQLSERLPKALPDTKQRIEGRLAARFVPGTESPRGLLHRM